jgi:putative flippase GtrA
MAESRLRQALMPGPDRRRHMVQIVKYLVVGVINTLFGYSIIFGCMYLLGIEPAASNMIGYGIGLVVSFLMHRHVTFASKGDQRQEFVRFLAVFAIAYLLNLGVLLALVYWLHVGKGISQVAAGTAYVAASYLMQKFYVFGAAKRDGGAEPT